MNFIKRKEPIMQDTKFNIYRHYIALDWSKETVAMATMRDSGGKIKVQVFQPDPRIIKEEIKKYKGSKILTIEETTTSHWLYVELRESVDKIFICDPYRNNLLKDGPQTDKIDAKKLCMLLRNGMMKEVYHTIEKEYEIRKLVSAYIDVIKASVRLKNQRSAIFRSEGKNHKKEKVMSDSSIKKFITQEQNELIEYYRETIERYELEFKKIEKSNKTIQNLKTISGIGTKTAIMIYSTVIDANRFESKYKYWGYCGLAKKYKESGGKIYRSKPKRYSKLLKRCYKSSALAAINGKSDIREYYEYLLQEGLSIEKARHQISRYISKVSYAVMKNKTGYRAYQWRESKAKDS